MLVQTNCLYIRGCTSILGCLYIQASEDAWMYKHPRFCTEDACTEIDILCTEVDCTDISYVPKVTVQILTFNVLKPAAPKKHVPKVYVPKLSCTESDVPLTYSVADLQQVCSGAGRNNPLQPSRLLKPMVNKRIERVFRWCAQAG